VYDAEVTQALSLESEAMIAFNEWSMANMPIRHEEVQNAIHRVKSAHRQVIAAHREWHRTGSSKKGILEACEQFVQLVSTIAR
jgi:hypothetical protein